ncbi:hypothetical protein [Rouxiella sp. WC2420]|uniref:Mor transcription activator domain-containing protein n=1 Tax=Rouxiella sp. WC2420 TaxID=3234145 RepID=A0AB39VW11_9GAMM
MENLWCDLFDGSIIESQSCLRFCDENKIQVLASLPNIASELAGLCGFSTMFVLIKTFGGRKIYLPKTALHFAKSTGMVIPDDEYLLWRRLAKVNGQMEIPSKWGIFLSLRRAAIYLSIKEGSDREKLIVSFGITQRQIRNLKIKSNYSF